jgi:hypothetical protein
MATELSVEQLVAKFLQGPVGNAKVTNELVSLHKSKRSEVQARLGEPSVNGRVVRTLLRDCAVRTASGGAALLSDAALKEEEDLRCQSITLLGMLMSTRDFAALMSVESVQLMQERFATLLRHNGSKGSVYFTAWALSTQNVFRAHLVSAALIDALAGAINDDAHSSEKAMTALLQAVVRLVQNNGERMRALLSHWGTAVFKRLADSRIKVVEEAISVLRSTIPLVVARPSDCDLAPFQRELARLVNGTLLSQLREIAKTHEARQKDCIYAWGFAVLFLGDELMNPANQLLSPVIDVAREFLQHPSALARCAAYYSWRMLADNLINWRHEDVCEAVRLESEKFARIDSANAAAAERSVQLAPSDLFDEEPVPPRQPASTTARDGVSPRSMRSLEMLMRPFGLLKAGESKDVLEHGSATLLHICGRLGPENLVKLVDVVWRPVMCFLLEHGGPVLQFSLQLLRSPTKLEQLPLLNGVEPLSPLPLTLRGVDLARMLPTLLDALRAQIAKLFGAPASAPGSGGAAKADDCKSHYAAWPELCEFLVPRMQRRPSDTAVGDLLKKAVGSPTALVMMVWDSLLWRCANALPRKPDRPSATDVFLLHTLVAFPFSAELGGDEQPERLASLRCALTVVLCRHLDDALARGAFAIGDQTPALYAVQRWLEQRGLAHCETARHLVRRACASTRLPQLAAVLRTLPAAPTLWCELAAQHVELLSGDDGRTPDALRAHAACLLTPIQRALQHDSQSDDDPLQLQQRPQQQQQQSWIGAWRQLCDELLRCDDDVDKLTQLRGVCGAVTAMLVAAALSPSQLAVVTGCIDALVDAFARAHELSERLAASAPPASVWRDEPVECEPPAGALAQLIAATLTRAHHSSYLADASARRTARLSAQVRSDQYAPLLALAAATRFFGTLRRSADMFLSVDLMHDALQLWTAETRPPATSLRTLDSDTCERLAERASELWGAVLQATRTTYTGAFDSAMLARLEKLLKLGFSSRHKSIVDATKAYWGHTFGKEHQQHDCSPDMRQLLARHELGDYSVTRFHAIAKRNLKGGAVTANGGDSKRARKAEDVVTHAAAEEDADVEQQAALPVIDKTHNPLLAALPRVPAPPRSTQVGAGDDDDNDAAGADELADVDALRQLLQRVEDSVVANNRLTAEQLAKLQWQANRLTFKLAAMLNHRLHG